MAGRLRDTRPKYGSDAHGRPARQLWLNLARENEEMDRKTGGARVVDLRRPTRESNPALRAPWEEEGIPSAPAGDEFLFWVGDRVAWKKRLGTIARQLRKAAGNFYIFRNNDRRGTIFMVAERELEPLE